MSVSEIPVTIAISAELVFETQDRSSGSLFFFVKALKAVNATIKDHYPESSELFKVILLNSSLSSDGLSDAIKSHGMEELMTPCRVAEEDLVAELQRNNTHLYLSAEPGHRVQEAMNAGIAAAVVFIPENVQEVAETPLRIVFDGDCVLFSDVSDRVHKGPGLAAYLEHEKEHVDQPMTEGPFKGFLEPLVKLQKKFYDNNKHKQCPIRTYLLTARDAGSAGYRALNTLKTWGLQIDEAYFLSGPDKKPLLPVIKPHIFFDDKKDHIKESMEVGILAGHVPY